MIESPHVVQAAAETPATIQMKVPRDQIRTVMGPAYKELMATVAAQGITPSGPWYSHHFRWPLVG